MSTSPTMKLPEEVDLLVAEKLMEYDHLRFRVGEVPKDYLDGVYEIYDILRENGVDL